MRPPQLLRAVVVLCLMCSPAHPQVATPDQVSRDRDLRLAAGNGQFRKVRDLLGEGADPNATDESGRTPLLAAARQGDVGVLRLLINAGADVNAEHPKRRRSVLAEAASRGHTEAVALLLTAGAQLDAGALVAAARQGNEEIVQQLLEAGMPPDEGLAPAAGGGRAAVMEQLIEAGADVNGGSAARGEPILAAAAQGGLVAAKLLVDAGADVNVVGAGGATPLHWAARYDEALPVTKLLVEAGARSDVADDEGVTPVRQAAITSAVNTYAWLLNRSAGEEPLPRNIDDDQSTSVSELLAQYLDQDRERRFAAQRRLVARGESIMPAVLKQIDSGTEVLAFAELFTAMGPRANAAIPHIDSVLGDKEMVAGALLTLVRMAPGNIDRLPAESKQRAAGALVASIQDHMSDVYGPTLMRMLVALGEEATPHLLAYLDGDHSGLRGGAARALSGAAFDSEPLEAALTRVLLEDEHLRVRRFAADGLRNPHFQSPRAKDALIRVLGTPRVEIKPQEFHDTPTVERRARQRERSELDELLRRSAVTLAGYGPDVVPELRPLIAESDDSTREAYAQVYKYLAEGGQGGDAFAALLDDENDELRRLAHRQMATLVTHGDAEAGEALLERYGSDVERKRDEAAAALAHIRSGRHKQRYLPVLLRIMEDDALARATRILALQSALWINSETVESSQQFAQLLPLLMDEVRHGELASRFRTLELLAQLGAAAAPVAPQLEEVVNQPLPGDAKNRGEVQIIRREAARALDSINEDVERAVANRAD